MRPVRLERTFTVSPAQAEEALERVAGDWGAGWLPADGGGRLELPALAGLRRERLDCRLELQPADGGGTRLTATILERQSRLHRPGVAITAIGAAGALTTVLWPLWPPLKDAIPLGALLALAAWLLVISRLRHAGLGEFLDRVGAELEMPSDAADVRY